MRVAARHRLAGVLLLVTAIAAGCTHDGDRSSDHPAPSDAAATGPFPNAPVVLVSIDTLRSDRLPVYGYGRIDTPAIDALRRDALLFERAYTPVPLTLPAHTSILTGLWPSDHGVRDNAGYRLATDAVPYLPRLLHDAGYRTAGAVSSYVLRSSVGLAEGFDLYEDRIRLPPRALLGSLQRSGYATLDAVDGWLAESAGSPFFLFFHIYEPHAPHEPPEPFAARYPSPYDGEVALADAIVGRLFDRLRELGVYDDALVVLLSDHGEGLYDHGDYEHGLLLYREALQVPLLVKLPGARRGGESIGGAASLVDVAPTILGLLGLEVPAEMDGRDLFGDEPHGAPAYSETLFPRFHFGWSELFSVIDLPYHFIGGPDPELYNLVDDPTELHNLVHEQRPVATRLRRTLADYDQTIQPPGQVDDTTRQRLAALGYLGGVGGDAEGPLPDPKTQLHVVEELKGAFEHYADHEYEAAAEAFRTVLAEQPRLIDAWEQLGHSLTALGRLDEAYDAFHQALELSHGSPPVAGAMAALLLKMGRLDEARRYAEVAVEGHEMSRETLAMIAIRQGDLTAAEKFVERAVAGRGTRLGPLVRVAELRLAQGRFDEVLAEADVIDKEAAAGDGAPVPGVNYLRGSAYIQLGRYEDAAQAYQREIEAFPSDVSSYGRLALVRARQQRPDAIRATIDSLLANNPTPEGYAEAIRTLRQLGSPPRTRVLTAQARERWPNHPALAGLLDGG